MNCAMARALKWSYFGTGLNNFAEEELINHLLNCPACRKEYEEYAKKCNWGEFNVEDIAAKFGEKVKSKEEEVTWLEKYKNKQVIKLAVSKAIREIILEERDRKFSAFLVKKLCQKLDHLEECYKKERTKKNAKSK